MHEGEFLDVFDLLKSPLPRIGEKKINREKITIKRNKWNLELVCVILNQ